MADEDDDMTSTEVEKIDFEGINRIYDHDIAPARTQVASYNQDIGQAYKSIKKDYGGHRPAAKAAFAWCEKEEMDADKYMRTYVGIINQRCGRTVLTYHSNDLVDMAENLSADLEGAASPNIFEEATEEELAQQEGRGEPKPGTGAAARKKMKESASADSAPALH